MHHCVVTQNIIWKIIVSAIMSVVYFFLLATVHYWHKYWLVVFNNHVCLSLWSTNFNTKLQLTDLVEQVTQQWQHRISRLGIRYRIVRSGKSPVISINLWPLCPRSLLFYKFFQKYTVTSDTFQTSFAHCFSFSRFIWFCTLELAAHQLFLDYTLHSSRHIACCSAAEYWSE